MSLSSIIILNVFTNKINEQQIAVVDVEEPEDWVNIDITDKDGK